MCLIIKALGNLIEVFRYTGCITLIDAICRAVSSNSNINTDDHIRQMERRLLNHKIFI